MTLCDMIGLSKNVKHATLDVEVKIGFFYFSVATLSDIVTSADGNTAVVSPRGITTHGKIGKIASAAKMDLPDLSNTKVTIELGAPNWAGTSILRVTVNGCGEWDGCYSYPTEDFTEFGPVRNPAFKVTSPCHLDVGGWKVKLKPR